VLFPSFAVLPREWACLTDASGALMKMKKRPAATTPLWLDILIGVAAGAAGTGLMNRTMSALTQVQPAQDKQIEREKQLDGASTEKAAEAITEPLGLELRDRQQRKRAGNAVHWAYGMAWGAGYALITRRFGSIPLLSGVVLGTGLWAIGDEILVPALGLAPKAGEFPVTTHAKALGGHLAYGAGVDATYRLLETATRQLVH
jgi:hypothetical protein